MKFVYLSFLMLINIKLYSQKLQINSFKVLDIDSTYDISKLILIDYKPKHIAISFSDSSNAEIECRLLKSENEKWINLHDLRYMTYANLFGGEYEFQVRNGKTNQIKSLRFSVELAFWQKLWFIPTIFLYLVFIIGLIIYIFFNYRFRQQSKLQKVRNDIASDLHDDMGATLSSIAFSAALLKKRATNLSPEINELLNRIKDDAEDSITKVRETVWAINPQNDTSEDLFEKFRTLSIQLLASKAIELDFSNELDEHQTLKLTMAQRRNCYMIIKEVLHNIIKHSEASKVKFCIQKSANGIVIFIEDNGIGFDQEQEFDGNGLLNFKKRAEEGLMIFSLNAEIGIGTAIKLEINEQ